MAGDDGDRLSGAQREAGFGEAFDEVHVHHVGDVGAEEASVFKQPFDMLGEGAPDHTGGDAPIAGEGIAHRMARVLAKENLCIGEHLHPVSGLDDAGALLHIREPSDGGEQAPAEPLPVDRLEQVVDGSGIEGLEGEARLMGGIEDDGVPIPPPDDPAHLHSVDHRHNDVKDVEVVAPLLTALQKVIGVFEAGNGSGDGVGLETV